jgi:monofunctional glycosyltransferase
MHRRVDKYSSELALYAEKLISVIKRRKVMAFLLYFLFLFYFSIPSLQIPFLEYNRFYVTSLMEQRSLENNLLFYPQHSWISINDVNPVLLKSIISMEDGSFFYHKGIDWKELNISLKLNQRRGRTGRGASTITMQTAKNLYLTTGKTFLRKGKEVLIAARMEKELSKKSILENYVNLIEWGDGIFGIKKAAEIYFNKTPGNLNRDESARLAAVIPSPLKNSPADNSAYVLRRSSIIRGRVNDIKLFPEQVSEKKTGRRINRSR